jgi:hypothetical protein
VAGVPFIRPIAATLLFAAIGCGGSEAAVRPRPSAKPSTQPVAKPSAKPSAKPEAKTGRQERYRLALSVLTKAKGAVSELSATTERLVSLDARGELIEVVDDEISHAEGDPKTREFRALGARIVTAASGSVRVERGSREDRDVAQALGSWLEVFVLARSSAQQRAVGGTWEKHGTYEAVRDGRPVTVRYALELATKAEESRAGKAVSTVAVTGTIETEPKQPRKPLERETIGGTLWLGQDPGESAGVFHVGRDVAGSARRKKVMSTSRDIAYAVAPVASVSADQLAARARFDAAHAAGCQSSVASQDTMSAKILEVVGEARDDGNADPGPNPKRPEGALSNDRIKRVISGRIGDVGACYDRLLLGFPGLQGRITVRFVIEADGSVKVAAVHADEIGHYGLGCCITKAVRGWRFPKPDGGLVLTTYPFMLGKAATAP